MSIKSLFNLKFPLIVFCLLLSACASGQNNKKPESEQKNESKTESKTSVNTILKKQILLTNEAQFSKNRSMEGASGFLIKYKDSVFAVTAKHLLGDAGGVEPEINPIELNGALIKWEMKPRVVTDAAKETVKLSAEGLDFSGLSADILLLKVVSGSLEIEPLTPNFELPTPGEALYIIGCPYTEDDCKQNSYAIEYVENEVDSLVSEMPTKVEMSGFSGAPLVNMKGEVVGILTGSADLDGKNYVVATPIREIQKIKF